MWNTKASTLQIKWASQNFVTQDRNGAFQLLLQVCIPYVCASSTKMPSLSQLSFQIVMTTKTKIVCSVNDRKCMLHLCESCSGKLGLKQYLSDLFSLHDFDSDDMMTYKQWAHTDRTAIFCITASVQEFIQTACNSFESLRQHHFIAKAQSSYLRTLKDLEGDQAVIMLDFAENYSFVVQDEVQGFHWNNAQATLHLFVIYYKSAGELQCSSLCVVSDCTLQPCIHLLQL